MTTDRCDAGSSRARAYPAMLFVTYALRDGSEARGYDDWLRRVDNPFFNAQPGVFHYSNWKLAAGPNPFAPRTHFDFLGMADEASLDPVLNGPDLNRFRDQWRALWGVAPVADKEANSQAYLCERLAVGDSAWSDQVMLRPGAAGETLAGWDTWRVARIIRGPVLPFTTFQLRFVANRAQYDAAAKDDARAMLGTLIATP